MQNDRRPKIAEPNRSQLRLLPIDIDQLVAPDDPVRAVWVFVEGMDCSLFYAQIKSTQGTAGRPASDPRLLLALWMQATLDGVGSARELARLCTKDLRYMWLCGGEQPNYHTLSDFRSNSAFELDALLTDTLASLIEKNLVDMNRVAHDGMRVRASVGAASFRSRKTLEGLRAVTREQVSLLKKELDTDPGAGSRRMQAARERAARERAERVERALEQMPKAEQRKKSNNGKKKSEPRVSTTDPDTPVMKMADGGFRPAVNVQFVSDTTSKVIVAVDLTTEGTDQNTMMPLSEQMEERLGVTPAEWLADGGCVTLANLDRMHGKDIDVIGPVREPRNPAQDRYAVRPTDSAAVADWRTRMKKDQTAAIYRLRGSTAELVNAHVRSRGLTQFLVRGVEKIRSVLLLHVITHNFVRELALT